VNATLSSFDSNIQSQGIYECPVMQIDEVARGIFLMRLRHPEISRQMGPGQFVNVRVRDELTPLLRRPFSVCQVNVEEGSFDLLWKIYGRGTALMALCKKGDNLNVLGPLGNGFAISPELRHAVLVAGGLGIAPMPFLAKRLTRQKIKTTVLIGARTRGELWGTEIFEALGAEVRHATDDGSLGRKGFVTELLREEMRRQRNFEIFSCGPMPMLSKVAELCIESKVDGQAAVETIMGCGFGICMGCPMIPMTGVKTYGRYLLTCVDGPVFRLDEVKLVD
jgi:dihydroorotate dehydrogenase electron transfer subunit